MTPRLAVVTFLVTGCASGVLHAASSMPALKPIFETDRSLLDQPWRIESPSSLVATRAKRNTASDPREQAPPTHVAGAPSARPLWPTLEFKLRVARPQREIDPLLVVPPPARDSYSLIIVDPELRTRSLLRANAGRPGPDAASKP